MTRWSLKKRIVIALAAIAVIHVAFYAGPRLRYSWPRVCPEAYDKAVSLLKGKLGEAAVANGVVRIPKDPVAVAYRGFAELEDVLSRTRLHLYLSGEEAFLFYDGLRGHEEVEIAARAPAEKGRQIWATLEYVEKASIEDGVRTDCRIFAFAKETLFCDRTWGVTRSVEDRLHRELKYKSAPAEPATYAKSLLRGAAAQMFLADPSLGWTSDARKKADILKSIAEASLPARSELDRDRLVDICQAYGECADRTDLPTLKRIKESSDPDRPKWYAFAYGCPIIGPKLWQRDFSPDRILTDELIRYPSVDRYILRIETSSGKDRDAQLKALLETAEGKGPRGNEGSSDALMLLKTEFPQAYRDLLVERFPTFCDSNQGCWVDLTWIGQMQFDERLVKLAASQPLSRKNYRVCAMLYKVTGDKSYLESIKDIVRSCIYTDLNTSREAMRALYDAYEKDKTLTDIPKFTREVFGLISRAGGSARDARLTPEYLGHNLLTQRMLPEDAAFAAIEAELVNEWQGVLEESYAVSARGQKLRAEAARALGQSPVPEAAAMLLRYVELHGMANEPTVARGVIDGLTIAGDAGALPALERVAGLVTYVPDDAARTPSVPDAERPLGWRLRRAIVTIGLRNADDPLWFYETLPPTDAPVWFYATLLPSDRRLITCVSLSRALSADQLRALLADPLCSDSRGDLIAALYIKDRRLLDRDVIRESGPAVREEGE